MRVGPEDRLARPQLAVELVGQIDGAGLGAIAAGVALRQVHEARVLADLDLKAARLAGDPLDIRQRDDLDVLVPRALHQLGRENAHGAVAGGKGLVELGHPAAYGGGGLQKIDLEAALGEVERGLDAGDAGPADQDRADSLGRLRPFPVVCDHSHASAPDSLGFEQRHRLDNQAAQRELLRLAAQRQAQQLREVEHR